MVAAASLETPRLRRDLPRVSKRLGGVPRGWGALSHLGRVEDRHTLATSLAGPLGAAGPGETTLFAATMEEWLWPEPPP